MKLRKKAFFTFSICGLIFLASAGFIFYQKQREQKIHTANEKRQNEDLLLAEQKLQEGQPLYAIQLVKKHLDEVYKEGPFSKEWLRVSVAAGTNLRDKPFLVGLYNWDKTLFQQNEEAALLVAEQMVEEGHYEDFTYLKRRWQPESNFAEKWLLLEADYCARHGNSRKAQNLLITKQFKHPYETDRLLRLAFLNLNEHPKVSWDYLSKACMIDPSNPDLRIYRAHFLNALGKDFLALQELNQAAAKHGDYIFLSEEQIEQHVRNKDYLPAIALIEKHLSGSTDPNLWLKALFLNKVIAPVQVDKTQLPEKKITPEIAYFLNLEGGRYCSDREEAEKLAANKEEFFWIHFIHLLKLGREEQAYHLAFKEHSLDSYYPALRQALIRTLAYRNPSITHQPLQPFSTQHFLFQQFESEAYSQELRDLLASKEIFSVLFLAAGWNEAALQLVDHNEQIEADLPAWYTIGIVKALAHQRSANDAINFAKIQKPNKHLALQLGKLYAKNHNPELAIAIFKKLAASTPPTSEQASYFLAEEYVQQEQYALAKEAIAKNNAWKSVEGRLLLARLSLEIGDRLSAEALYATLAHQSPEAKSYFASKAFYEKDYQLAYELTKSLLRENPENGEFKQNLEKITQAARQRSL
ncbi:hypothetical protein PHSC3_000384 [Chlamydiales bacterium STE3]|nr:hypothetical protein PHSC3_000384 [Chlamydiales bacterium STE3]